MMELRPGIRLQSVVCATQVVVVRAGAAVDLRCGGHPMVPVGSGAPNGTPPDGAHTSGTLLGKRYADAESGLELLCTKPGEGSLAVGDHPLATKQTRQLPSSD